MEEEQLQLSIRRLLIKIGIRIDLDGFDYLVSAVEFAIKDAELAKICVMACMEGWLKNTTQRLIASREVLEVP